MQRFAKRSETIRTTAGCTRWALYILSFPPSFILAPPYSFILHRCFSFLPSPWMYKGTKNKTCYDSWKDWGNNWWWGNMDREEVIFDLFLFSLSVTIDSIFVAVFLNPIQQNTFNQNNTPRNITPYNTPRNRELSRPRRGWRRWIWRRRSKRIQTWYRCIPSHFCSW